MLLGPKSAPLCRRESDPYHRLLGTAIPLESTVIHLPKRASCVFVCGVPGILSPIPSVMLRKPKAISQ